MRPSFLTTRSPYICVLLFAAVVGLARAEPGSGDPQPDFCGSPEKHRVVEENRGPQTLRDGNARVYIYWRGLRWRWWSAQCKVALNGSWVAILNPNTYSVLDVDPGTQKFCGAGVVTGHFMSPTWRSLLFLHAEAGKTYYIECSPGADDMGATEPTLSEPKPADGQAAISKCRRVTFQVKPMK